MYFMNMNIGRSGRSLSLHTPTSMRTESSHLEASSKSKETGENNLTQNVNNISDYRLRDRLQRK